MTDGDGTPGATGPDRTGPTGGAGEAGATVTADGNDETDEHEHDGDSPLANVPDWDDDYLDRVSDRLLYSYDLERDRRVDGERFALYGRLEVENRKQFLHPAITYGHHETTEHLLVRRTNGVSVADIEALASLGERLGEAWVEPDERHFATEFVFGLVAPSIPAPVREHVADFESRTLLNYGYHGHYSVHLFVVAPRDEALVASPGTDVATAFRLWNDGRDEGEAGVVGRLASVLGLDGRS